jgi:hypothetical protein
VAVAVAVGLEQVVLEQVGLERELGWGWDQAQVRASVMGWCRHHHRSRPPQPMQTGQTDASRNPGGLRQGLCRS